MRYLLCGIAIATILSASPLAAVERPNIVFILADDE